jgi:nitronate monooxygenase
MTRLRTPLSDRLGIEHPIIQAPMAGGVTPPALVVAASEAGALGSFGHAYTQPDGMRADAAAVRARTARPFGINLFTAPLPDEPPEEAQRRAIAALSAEYERRGVAAPARVPPPYGPDLAAQIEAVCDVRPRVFSTHIGDVPAATVARLRGLGIAVGGAATSVAEARRLEGLGVDFVVAQGAEAGGHRGTYLHRPEDVMTGTLALVRQIVRAVRVPVVAAGGIVDGAGIAAVLALGAQAAQIGTAFLVCPESGAPAAHKKAVTGMDGDETVVTRAFSGKPARAVRNHFIEAAAREGWPILPFPAQSAVTAPLRASSVRADVPDHYSCWSGQAGSLARPLPVADLVRTLADEAADAIEGLRRLLA